MIYRHRTTGHFVRTLEMKVVNMAEVEMMVYIDTDVMDGDPAFVTEKAEFLARYELVPDALLD